MKDRILTRFLVLSDTHAEILSPKPEIPVDVLIHCGDLTEWSTLAEFETMIDHIQSFNAPLKLIIAGNHDFTLDSPWFKRAIERKLKHVIEPEARKSLQEEYRRKYGDLDQARALFESEEAKSAGIVYLEEGSYCFELANGASLKVFASPYSPGKKMRGFKYFRKTGHDWLIAEDTDVVITHCPPLGILDHIHNKTKPVGSEDLFAAVACIRPLMHCFGHIHEGWGAKCVTWRKTSSKKPSCTADIDDKMSQLIGSLSGLKIKELGSPKDPSSKALAWSKYKEQGYCAVPYPPKQKSETIFVNAAIQNHVENDPPRFPWLVNLELPQINTHRRS